jgi:hypothetical protein
MKVESPLADLEIGIDTVRRVGNDLVLRSRAGGTVDTVITVSAGEVLRTLGTVLASPSGLGFLLGLPFFWVRQRLGIGVAPGSPARGHTGNINKPW